MESYFKNKKVKFPEKNTELGKCPGCGCWGFFCWRPSMPVNYQTASLQPGNYYVLGSSFLHPTTKLVQINFKSSTCHKKRPALTTCHLIQSFWWWKIPVRYLCALPFLRREHINPKPHCGAQTHKDILELLQEWYIHTTHWNLCGWLPSTRSTPLRTGSVWRFRSLG